MWWIPVAGTVTLIDGTVTALFVSSDASKGKESVPEIFRPLRVALGGIHCEKPGDVIELRLFYDDVEDLMKHISDDELALTALSDEDIRKLRVEAEHGKALHAHFSLRHRGA